MSLSAQPLAHYVCLQCQKSYYGTLSLAETSICPRCRRDMEQHVTSKSNPEEVSKPLPTNFSAEAVDFVASVMRGEVTSDVGERLRAARMLFEWGWGPPPFAPGVSDGE